MRPFIAPACATKGQVKLLQNDISSLRIETARRDSVRAAALAAIIGLQQRIMDSLVAGREALRTLDVRIQADLTGVQRQLLQVQELTGQSQSRLSELKAASSMQRAEQAEATALARPPADSAATPGAVSPAGTPVPTADQMYQGAKTQLNRGAAATARRGFQELVRSLSARTSWCRTRCSTSARASPPRTPIPPSTYYTQVLLPLSPRAQGLDALYKLGLLESGAGTMPRRAGLLRAADPEVSPLRRSRPRPRRA